MNKRVVIVGAGISGLTAAWELRKRAPSLEVVVLEAGSVAGGTARTERVDGFTFDMGPNGFLTNTREGWDLAHEVGIGAELKPAAGAANRRYLVRRGRLVPLPTGPLSLAGSPLLSVRAKLSLLRELFTPPLAAGQEESVWSFVARRTSPEVADLLATPVVLGVTAGDAKQTSVDALFPRFRQLEQAHGSLVRGMFAGAKASRALPDDNPIPAPTSRALTSFGAAGAGRLCEALGERLQSQIRYGWSVASATAQQGGWLLRSEQGEELSADALILATPAHRAASLVEASAPPLAQALRAISYADIRVVALAYPETQVAHPMDGFGFLSAPSEGRSLLGTIWSSSVFQAQAKPGFRLMRVLLGGVHRPDLVKVPAAEAVAIVRTELAELMGVSGEPTLVRVFDWPRGIPQYTLGHGDRVAAIEAATAALPGLWLTGNGYRGVGVNDCVRDGRRVAAGVLQSLGVTVT
jgi:oxygen-dependent protoporphyrinogen oxidase